MSTKKTKKTNKVQILETKSPVDTTVITPTTPGVAKTEPEIICGFVAFLKTDGTYGFRVIGLKPELMSLLGLGVYAHSKLAEIQDQSTKGNWFKLSEALNTLKLKK